MAEQTGRAFDFDLLKRVLGFMKPYRVKFVMALVFTLTLSAFAIIKPYIIMTAVNDYIANGDERGLANQVLYFIGVLIAEVGVQFYQIYLANWLGQSVTLDLRSKLYKHIINLRLKYFDKNPIGALVTRVVSDIDGISEIFSEGLLIMIGDLLKLVGVIVFMFYINWQLTLIVLAPIPLLIIATRIFKNAIKRAFIDVRNQVSKLNSFVQEHVTGMSIVQVFAKEEVERKKFHEINRLHRDAHIKSVWAYSIFFPVVELLSSLSLALLIWWGMSISISKDMSETSDKIGIIIGFILYVHMLYRPIRQLADRFNTLQMGIVNAERVFKVLDTDQAIPDQGKETSVDFNGEISFESVWFAYNKEDYVLKNISFDVQPGQTIAFVGSTGAGKSSVVNLLSRFYEYQKGKVEIEGKDIRSISISSIRENIAVVLQDVFLFSDSIHNNITLKDDSISREKVIEAAKTVGAHDFIMKLPGNYDYNVRERGTMLSVGQRQLLAFIRAYVYDPKILILDEATSSIDSESELLIQHAIDKLTHNRTSIVIAHRLSTIQKADQIIVLDQGRIIERGNHQELLNLDGAYKNLYDLQFL